MPVLDVITIGKQNMYETRRSHAFGRDIKMGSILTKAKKQNRRFCDNFLFYAL